MTQTIDPPNGNSQLANRQSHAATVSVGPRGMDIRSFADLWSMAQVIQRSGLAPKGFDSTEKIVVALEHGMELGLPPMAALRSIAVVNGRPSIYGDAALALVRGSGLCDYFLELPSNTAIHDMAVQLTAAMELDDTDSIKQLRKGIADASAKIDRKADDFGYTSISQRKGAITSVVYRFTIGDAKRASLWGKQGPWTQYPDRMLMFRSRGFNLRDNFGDVLQGMVTSEEAADLPSIRVSSLPVNTRAAVDSWNASPVAEITDQSAGAPGTASDPFPQPTEQSDPAPATQPFAPAESDDSPAPVTSSSQDDDQRTPELPPIPADHEGLVDAVARLCGLEMDVAEKKLKLQLPKTWDKTSEPTRAAWWSRFCGGQVAGLVPQLSK